VGANDDGRVTIYSGIPEEIAGLDLKDVVEESDVAVSDLPEFLRSDVQEGIKVESREDAEDKVADLENRARDFGETTPDRRKNRNRDNQKNGA
jgi:protein phosphatase